MLFFVLVRGLGIIRKYQGSHTRGKEAKKTQNRKKNNKIFVGGPSGR